MSIHYEQVEHWLDQNKSRLMKPAFIQNLFYKHVPDSIEHEPEFPIYLLAAICMKYAPDTRKHLFSHWRKQYPSLLKEYDHECNRSELAHSLSQQGYVLDLHNKTCLKPEHLYIVDNCMFNTETSTARYYIYHDGQELKFIFTVKVLLSHTDPLKSHIDIWQPQGTCMIGGYIFSEMMKNVSTHKDASTILDLLLAYKVPGSIDYMFNSEVLDNMSLHLNRASTDICVDILSFQMDLPRSKVATLYSLGLVPEDLLFVLKNQSATPDLTTQDLPQVL